MTALYRWLRTQPMTDSIVLAICGLAAVVVVAVKILWGLPE